MPRVLALAVLAVTLCVLVGCNRVRTEVPAADAPAAGDRTGPPPPPAPDALPDLPTNPKAAPAADPKPPAKPLARREPSLNVVARWAVPVAVIDGRKEPGDNDPEELAVSDDGARVVVRTSRLVDVWYKGRPAALRIQHKRWDGAYLAPNAERAYIANGEPSQFETWDVVKGQRLATWNPPSSIPGWFPRYLGAGFHPDTHALTVVVSTYENCGFFDVNPNTGQGTRTVPIKEMHETTRAENIFPLRNGNYLAHCNSTAPTDPPRGFALYKRDGTRVYAPRMPADATAFGYSRHPAVSQDERFATLVGNRLLTVWDARTGAAVMEWSKRYYFPTQCAFVRNRLVLQISSDYEKWHTGGFGGITGVSGFPTLIQMFDVDTLKKLGELDLTAAKLPAHTFAFSPNGRYLALANRDQVVVLDADDAFGLPK